ncbi:MAG: signal recognition particle-docking protein FtsY [Helicobacteraceae bacterium]
MIESDVYYDLVEEILKDLPKKVPSGRLYNELIYRLPDLKQEPQDGFSLDLIIGVNGAGKTTTVAKLANLYKTRGKKPLVVAADTFRAAAVEQLDLWAKNIGVEILKGKTGADSSGLCYDAVLSAKARGLDKVIIDTAGRLENNQNLLNELEKIVRVVKKADENLIINKYLIIDATQGTMALNQARVFNQHLQLDGIIVTKLDGTSRAGAIFSIVRDLGLPILFTGLGEGVLDLVSFNAKDFVEGFVSAIYGQDS